MRKSTSRQTVFNFVYLEFLILLIFAIYGIYAGIKTCDGYFQYTDILSVDTELFAKRLLMVNLAVALFCAISYLSGICSVLSAVCVFVFSCTNAFAIYFCNFSHDSSMITTVVSCLIFALCDLIVIFSSCFSIKVGLGSVFKSVVGSFMDKRAEFILAASAVCVGVLVFFVFSLIFNNIVF